MFELRYLKAHLLLAKPHFLLGDTELLPLKRGIQGRQPLVLLLECSTAAVPVSLGLQAQTHIPLLLDGELDAFNAELRALQLN